MSAESRDLGRRGEAAAASYLVERGWEVVDRNVRVGHREVDLIIRRGPVLAFVEVKTRRGKGFGHPLEAITRKKRGEIRRVARDWIRDHSLPAGLVFRFDAVAVWWEGKGPSAIVHVPDAWRYE